MAIIKLGLSQAIISHHATHRLSVFGRSKDVFMPCLGAYTPQKHIQHWFTNEISYNDQMYLNEYTIDCHGN